MTPEVLWYRRSRDGCTTTRSRDGRTTTRRQKKHTLSPRSESILIARETEPPLRLGSCVLARPEVAELIQHALRHFHGQRYYLSAWCVMPNHVHAVVTPNDGWELSVILHSWKSFTAHRANKVLKRRGTFWERESFDHLIRTFEHFEAFIHYIENNPVEAHLCQAPEDWAWSSARLRKREGKTETCYQGVSRAEKTRLSKKSIPEKKRKNAAGTAAPQRKDR